MMANRSPAQQKERRGGPSQHAIELGVNLASAYLAPTSLAALCACSRAMKDLASTDAVWSAHTRREYPWSAHLRTVGGACAVSGRREFLRLRKMSERHLTKIYPGVEAYSALVVIEDRGATIIEGLFDIDETGGELSINVLPANEKLCVDFELLEEARLFRPPHTPQKALQPALRHAALPLRSRAFTAHTRARSPRRRPFGGAF